MHKRGVAALSGWTFAMLLIAASAGTAAQVAKEPVALVTELAGTGRVSQKPQDGALQQLHELAPGTIVSLTRGARAVLVHTPTGTVYELAGPGRFQVGANGVDALEGSKLAKRELPPAIKSFQLKPLSTMQASIVMRGAPTVRLEGPDGGVLSDDELTYRVRGTLEKRSVELIDAEGATHSAINDSGTGFNPASSAALQPGRKYLVRVRGTDTHGRATELSARFWLIDPEAADRLTAARPGSDATLTELIVYAMAVESAGATASARAAWQRVNGRRPP
jgi:hypothetical protein